MSSRNARPLKIRPSPNFRGMDGFALTLASATHTHATIGAKMMIATAFTLWNQPVGNVQLPNCRFTIWSARKVNELPACSKNIQNMMLNTKISSMAIVLSRATAPSRMPSTISIADRPMNIAVSTYWRFLPPTASSEYTTGTHSTAPIAT